MEITNKSQVVSPETNIAYIRYKVAERAVSDAGAHDYLCDDDIQYHWRTLWTTYSVEQPSEAELKELLSVYNNAYNAEYKRRFPNRARIRPLVHELVNNAISTEYTYGMLGKSKMAIKSAKWRWLFYMHLEQKLDNRAKGFGLLFPDAPRTTKEEYKKAYGQYRAEYKLYMDSVATDYFNSQEGQYYMDVEKDIKLKEANSKEEVYEPVDFDNDLPL